MKTKVITILSGGMDSATLAYEMAAQHYEQQFLTFNYGQRHKVEIKAAEVIAQKLGGKWHCVDLTGVGCLLKGSALTDEIDVPHGHYAEESMRKTVVPNRNMIMLSIAWGVMVSENAHVVATGIHAGDHFIYPDCRPAFFEALAGCATLATDGHAAKDAMFYAPYLNKTKRDIGDIGKALGVPWESTWSCYEGGSTHCGVCGACNERKEALAPDDPTVYLA